MLSLVLTTMSIALLSVTVLASINYLDPGAQFAADLAERMERGVLAFQRGYDDYVASQGGSPSTLAELTPEYAFTPVAPQGTSWGYGSALGGDYACLSGTVTRAAYRALENLESRFSAQRYFIDSACPATADNPPGAEAAGTEGVAVTYWLSPYSP
jgi:hypothetical protein